MIYIDENVILEKYSQGNSVLSISKELDITYCRVLKILKENNVIIRDNHFTAKKYHCDENFFENIDTESKAYWLGFIAADGYISKSKNYDALLGISLSIKDYSHLEKFKEAICANNPIHIYCSTGYSTNEYCRVVIQSQKMVDDLISHGIRYKKSLILNFSDCDVSETLMRHYVRGYFDGDGCLTKHLNSYGKFAYAIKICGTQSMLRGFEKYFDVKKEHKLGKRRKDNKDNYSLEIGGNTQVLNILKYLYEDSKIYLDRKYKIATELLSTKHSLVCK